MLKPSLSIRIIDSTIDVDAFRDILISFDTFVAPSTMLAPSLKKYWLLSFIQTYGTSRNLAITVVFEDAIPKLIMPLQIKDAASLEFLCDETSDYNDFLFSKLDVELVKYALKFWVSKGIQHIRLDKLPPDSKTVEFLSTISTLMGWEIKIDNCDSLPIVIAQPEKEIQNWIGVNKHAIKRYKRKQTALKRIADVSFSFVDNTSQLEELFPAIRYMHIARWKLNGIYSKYMDPRRESFIINVCNEAIKEKTLFFPIMKIDGTLASYVIGFRHGDMIFDWNTSFSVDYFRWSPGALLLLYVLSNSKELGYSKYNLMKGLESYKFIWTNYVEYNLTLVINIQ